MELSSGQRKALFALVVAALTALGIFMFVPGARGARGQASPPPTSPARTAPSSPSPNASTPATPTGSSPAPGTTTPPAADIYQWLPFSQAGLDSAAAVVTRFGNAYGTFSYTESAAAYVNSMQSLIVSDLSQVLEGDYSAPGVASQRIGEKQISTGSTVIDSLQAFGSSSITFVVTISRQITDTSGRSRASAQYEVTVTGEGTSWLVNNIELAGVGNS
jgi:hypothetical protein